MIVMVEDDGIGFDSQEIDKGMGTENIASRVNYLKGDLSVHSVKGTGTTTMINIPLPKIATTG
jgi:signal transduction histidine kinase